MRPSIETAGDPGAAHSTGPAQRSPDHDVDRTVANRLTANPVRARRLQLGLTQEQTADLANIPLATFKRWDRGEKRPRHPERAAALAAALETTVDDLWGGPTPAPDNATPPTHIPDPDTDEPAAGPTWTPPAGSVPGVPSVEEVLRTLDQADGERRARRWLAAVLGSRRGGLKAAVGLCVALLVVGIAIVASTGGSTSSESPSLAEERRAPTTTFGASVSRPAAAESWSVELAAASDRGDYDRAIALSRTAGMSSTAVSLKDRAARVLIRRARLAAGRGDVRLARSRMRRARERYDTTPGAEAVRRQIRRLFRDRAKRRERRRLGHSARRAPSSPAPTVPVNRTRARVPVAPPATRPPTAASTPAGTRRTAQVTRRAPVTTHSAEREFGP
jgi:transcriptional regulator with XRE-family HTH domain